MTLHKIPPDNKPGHLVSSKMTGLLTDVYRIMRLLISVVTKLSAFVPTSADDVFPVAFGHEQVAPGGQDDRGQQQVEEHLVLARRVVMMVVILNLTVFIVSLCFCCCCCCCCGRGIRFHVENDRDPLDRGTLRAIVGLLVQDVPLEEL